MTQSAIQVSEQPPLPGLQLVQQLNAALMTTATDFAGGADPAALAGPYMTWADIGTGLLKRRNPANTAWIVIGSIFNNQDSGRLLNVRVFVSGGVYTPTSGTNTVVVELLGGGGAGAGSSATNASQLAVGSGGGAGHRAIGRFTSGFSGVTVAIGAGGAPNLGGAGGTGGTTSFGGLMTVNGGAGGTQYGPTGSRIIGGASNSNVSAPGSLLAIQGESGGPAFMTDLNFGLSGAGGSGQYGDGGSSAGGSGDGTLARGYGSGGGGAMSYASSPVRNGGNGRQGLAIIWEYA